MRPFAALLLPLTALAAAAAQPADQLRGRWEGQLLLNSNWRFMEASFTGEPPAARVDLPQERRRFEGFSRDGDTVRWTLLRGQARIAFEGTLDGDVIRGHADQNGVRGEFQLVRIATPRADVSRYTGTYRTPSGDLVSVARFDFGDEVDRLAMIDTGRGLWGMLLQTGPSTFVLAPARSGRFPPAVTVEFDRGGSGAPAATLALRNGASRSVARRAERYDATEVTFTSGDVTLAGTLVRTRLGGSRPAAVVVHSSGNQSRNGPTAYFRLIANVLASHGITTLVYDKRGVGGSTGSWPDASFADLAADATAAVAQLRGTAGVDPGRVGFLTLSQGGWVAPLAASSDERIAFLALVSAAATSPARQEIDRVSAVMRTAGYAEADVAAAAGYLRTFFAVVSGAEPWASLESAMTRTAGERWLSYVPRPRSADEIGWAPAPATLEPADIFATVRAPVLAVHGAEDVDVPARVNAPLFARLSRHSGSRQRTFPRADHYMLESVRDPDRDYRRLAPGFLDLLVEWIGARAAVRPDAPRQNGASR